jgi:rSAM/selenodomain-associated transferase 2
MVTGTLPVISPRAPHDPLVTIVIPVLDDTAALTSLLFTLPVDPSVQVVVVDGGEAHEPAWNALRECHPAVEWMRSARGRGVQMNIGAKRARGRWLVFLHADTRLGAGWLDLLRRLDDHPSIVGGSFRFSLDSTVRWARWIEHGVRLRVRWFDLAYGDQALFARRDVFEELRGYRDLPLMEDVDFIRRLRRRGRLEHADVPALTSARRWERDGWVRRTVENTALILLFLAGWPPARLARRYHRRAGSS